MPPVLQRGKTKSPVIAGGACGMRVINELLAHQILHTPAAGKLCAPKKVCARDRVHRQLTNTGRTDCKLRPLIATSVNRPRNAYNDPMSTRAKPVPERSDEAAALEALRAAIAESDADPRVIPHEDMR